MVWIGSVLVVVLGHDTCIPGARDWDPINERFAARLSSAMDALFSASRLRFSLVGLLC
jgi:hypothetical protein